MIRHGFAGGSAWSRNGTQHHTEFVTPTRTCCDFLENVEPVMVEAPNHARPDFASDEGHNVRCGPQAVNHFATGRCAGVPPGAGMPRIEGVQEFAKVAHCRPARQLLVGELVLVVAQAPIAARTVWITIACR